MVELRVESDGDTITRGNVNAKPHADPDSDTVANTKPDPDAHANTHSDSYPYPNSRTNADAASWCML